MAFDDGSLEGLSNGESKKREKRELIPKEIKVADISMGYGKMTGKDFI